ncbi:UDP-2,3-diacylglucosamine diphosphatase [Marivirga atlantica]|jgi:UDP-2,3-diacylglucosamine pyrophosphatase LpxH|uniref:UDP-2,3-diacylglucosamine diphosphatase n=1 Tax=Marivirga atlantica TaxID=1548457 RepID=A0A937AE16_9BACT|nr:UDP-2,3-diacylglucosamine diphosphatase [Marivirga atlantica]MBL0764543.1 UDP-2,3-diacylglucosamine diphosphatase [Marivirga atlantica]
MKTHYKTLVISDVHLGTKGSKAKELVKFMKQVSCDKLILNGDIIDGWQLKKYGKWKRKHTRFFNRILKMIEEFQTEVIYLRGNHDDFLDQILPFKVGNLSIQRDYVLESGAKKYYIVHGDIFDSITTNLKWVAKLGDVGYTFLLWVNGQYNNYRRRKGLPYYSLSQVVKSKVKSAVSYIDDFETQLAEIAKLKNCDGIICGHIHQPAIKEINGIHYMNSGDWVESMSALAEDKNGEWSLVYFAETKDKSFDVPVANRTFSAYNDTEESDEDIEALRKKTA